MKTCTTCRHYKGTCLCPSIVYNDGSIPLPTGDEAHFGGGPSAFVPGPDFGCVHHKEVPLLERYLNEDQVFAVTISAKEIVRRHKPIGEAISDTEVLARYIVTNQAQPAT